MHPTRPSLADAMRTLNRLKTPTAAKYDGWSPHRMAITPKPDRGLVAIVVPNGLFYANTVGALGVVSAVKIGID